MPTDTIIDIYRPRSRKKEATISSIIPRQTITALEERLGAEAANRARATLQHLEAVDGNLMQFRIGEGPEERRIRVIRGSEPLEPQPA